MDPSRVQRFGKPYYRSNYIPHNTRQTLEDRLHPPGISTSSNSSWTFSNSHCDIPKPKKGRLCGIFLIGAVLVVALAVIAIAGLAFYIGGYTIEKHHFSEYQTKDLAGAKRQYSTKQSQTTLKSVFRHTSKTSATTERTVENLSTVSMQTKTIPEGAILGISETMKQLNKGLRNKKKEEPITTGIPDDFSTEDLFEEKNQYDSQTENIEIVPEKLTKSSTTVTANDRIDESHAVTEYDSVKNGHARPNHVVETTTTTTTTTTTSFADLQPPRRVYSDEPWRPIIPSYRDTMRVRNPYREEYQDKLFEHRHGVLVEPGMENDTPITFSRESYEQNLRITPEYAGSRDKVQVQNNPASRISDQIAIKYKDLVKDHRIGSPESVAEVVVTSVDIITAPPLPLPRPSDIIIVSESSTSSALSVYYNATEESRIKEPQKPSNPVGLHQIISGINMAESEIKITKTSTSKPVAKTTQKISTQTTPNLVSTNITEDNTATTTTTVLTNKTTPETTLNTNFSVKASTMTNLNPTTTHTSTEAITSSQSSPKNTIQTTQLSQGTTEENVTVKNPFLDDSRSVSSNFNFGIPELPILKQFHHLDSLFKSFSKPGVDSNNQYSKYFVRSDDGNEKAVTRFPARTKPTTAKSYKKDDSILYESSTTSPEPTTTPKPLTRKPVVIKGEVEVVSGPIKHEPVGPTTEIPKLITLLPVRSNVNMMRPLRPRPKSNVNSTITIVNRRKSKMSSDFKSKELPKNESGTSEMLFSVPYQQKQFINDKNGKRWVYYSSSKSNGGLTVNNEKLFIVTPEPKTKTNELEEDEKDYGFFGNVTNLPLYNTIESLLNLDYRDRNAVAKNSTLRKPGKNNTSEIVDKIVKIVENVAISTGDSPKVIVKVNQTVLNRTTELAKAKNETTNLLSDTEIGLSTKAVASHYKLNQAGVPVLTKILNKVPAYKKEELPLAEDAIGTTWNEEKGCGKNSFKCGNDTCLPVSKKCNQFIDCPDADDEQNCKCSEHLKAQKLHRKLCDGIVDCWDFSDEFNCEWCKEEILCSNSKVCIRKDQICDGINNCPMGDDERNCVTVSPSRAEADTFSYHHNGYLMVRKNGLWGKLCVDNFDSVSLKAKTGWKITDLGRTVCKALTFKDFDKVERMVSVPNEGRSFESNDSEKYYELAYNETSGDQHSPRESVLSFHETSCTKKEVVKVTCTDLECGLRPQATNQWSRKTFSESSDDELSYNSGRHSRIVGGGNASPGSWPWQAALYKEGEFQCGGTLISENWLISAGHCFHHNQDAYWVARLGTLRTTLLLPSPYEQLRKISKIILHPQYVDNGFINDISLLRMRDPVKFTDYVRPICLPKPYAPIVDGKICTVVGWGQLSEVGWIFPDTLQEVQLPILSSNECRKRTIFLPLYKVTDDMFCAGYDRGGRDACLGDSGGPLMCQEVDGRWSLFGVTSNGYGCGRSNRPGVYTKVSKYLNWINAQMNLHSEVLTPITDFEEKQYFSTSRSFTEDETTQLSENNEEQDVIIKQITQRVSNVKLNPENTKYKDKCKGHRCPLGECLPKSHVCDGHIECSDGSDEKDCW